MIEFKFPCPNCGQRIQATDAYSGRQINCPACQKPMVVPPASGAQPASPAMATPPPVPPAQSAPKAPGVQRPMPAAKKSNAKWILIGSATGLVLVVGAVAFVLFSGVLSHSAANSPSTGDKPVAALQRQASKSSASASLAALSAAEIVQKVADQYNSLTSYSATGIAVTEMDMSKVDITKMPGMDKIPASAQKSQEFQKMMSKPVRTESGFTIRLGRPDFYRIEWENKAGPAGMNVGVWSAGEGDFVSLSKMKYTKVESRDLALASANGASGGVASTMPAVFFNDLSSQLNLFKQAAERGEDDTVDGENCYVLNGDAMGVKVTLWITKDTFLIKQKQMLFGGTSTMPEMRDAKMEAELEKLGNLTPQQKAQARAAMKNMKPMLSQMKGTMTETYRKIEINQPVKKEDFNHELPADAVLTKSLF
ncbi:MAG: hypothetical protein JWQ04_1378 [Pedosphaera sp.]|nr:hypothetical protein [Pedosphaera sp.]